MIQTMEEPEILVDVPDDAPPDQEDGGGEEYRTILEIWREVLKPVDAESRRKVTTQWAARLVGGYAEISFKDMTLFRDIFFAKVLVLSLILEDEIQSDDECLKRISPEEDAQLNGIIYRTLLTRWQKEFLSWELRWDCEQPYAAVELAALAEVHKMFFDPTGLISLLDQIGLEFTEADQTALQAELQALKDAVDAG